jgi:hypothetical protein
MSARAAIECDYFNADAPIGERFCDACITAPTLTWARKNARQDGWTHVPNRVLRSLAKDYCPEHKPAPEAAPPSPGEAENTSRTEG